MSTLKIALAILAVVAYSGYIGTSSSLQDTPNPQDSSTNSCIDKIISDIKDKYTTTDEEKAKKSASNYSISKSKITESYKINSVSQTWTNDPIHCTATLKNILVQYVSDSDEPKQVITLVVDPKSYAVKDINIKEDLPVHDSATSPSWGGYAIKGASTESVSLVYRSTMNWIIPIPSDPPQLDCGTLNAQKCYISVWTGLSRTEDGTSDMVQVGTDSVCLGNNCSSGQQYKGWLETSLGGHISDCTGNTFASGDSMYGEVVNQKKNGGAVNKYDFYLIDTTQNQTCSALNQTFGSTDPHYGIYMTERPNFDTLAHLADFGTISNLHGTIYYDNTNKNIYVPYSSGSSWYRQWIMNNGVNNEAISEIGSTNYFSVTWLTSQGT